MGLNEYLEKIVTNAHYPITYAATEPRPLSRWLVRAVTKDATIPWGADPYLDENARILLLFETETLPVETLESHWRYSVSVSVNEFQDPSDVSRMFSKGPNKFAYSLANIYALEDQDVLINAVTFLAAPFRFWVNGELALTGSQDYVTKDALIRVRLKKGNNIVLTELSLDLRFPLNEHGFILKLQPLERLLRDGAPYAYLDKDRLELLRASGAVYPEKTEALPGETLRLVALPRYVGCRAGEPVEVRLADMDGRTLVSVQAEWSRLAEITVPSGVSGVLRLRIAADGEVRPASPDVCILAGEYDAECGRLLERAASRSDLPAGFLDSMRGLAAVPAMFRESNQYILYEIADTLLRMWGELERFLATPERDEAVTFAEIFPSGYAASRVRQAGDDRVVYQVHLPEGFDPENTYPVAFFLGDRFGRHYPGELPWVRELPLRDAIVVNVVGIGRLNYVDDLETLRTLSEALDSLPADRERVYGIGYCTGALKVFRLAICVPGLFAGIVSMSGEVRLSVNEPEHEWLVNLDHTQVTGLYNYEDWFFNTSRMIANLERMKRAGYHLYGGFMHTELHALHNSRTLLESLFDTKRLRFPREIDFVVLAPCFVKSYWLIADDFETVRSKARLRAVIPAPDEIRLSVEHVRQVSLLLSREDMGLEETVRIAANGSKVTVRLPAFSRVSVSLAGGSVFAAVQPLNAAEFYKACDDFGAREDLLGIKRLYLRPCKIVAPARRTAFTRKLAYLLQNPLRERYLFYKYDSCREEDLDLRPEGRSAHVLIVDAGSKTPLQERLLSEAGLSAEPDALRWNGETAEGDYFAFVSCVHPHNPEGLLLFAVYNNSRTEDEMIRLLGGFDTNPLFYEEAVVYSGGAYRNWTRRGEAGSVTR